jgi:O-antigen/teichoic acid export membrane protein
MKKLINSSLKQGMLYGMSIALMKGISLLMLPFIAHQLSTDEYGRLEVIGSIAIIGSILIGMGLEDTLFRFAGSAVSKRQRGRIASEIFSLTILITIIALIFGWFVASPIAALTPGNPSNYEVRLVLSLIALEGCIAVPLGWLRMNNRAISFFIASCGRALLQAVLVVIFLYLDRGIAGILEAGLIAGIAQMLLLSYLQVRDTGLHFSLERSKHSFIYSLPIMGSGLVAFALNGLDRWVLAEHSTLADVAEFGIAAKFALATVLLMQPFGMWWSPRRFAVLTETNGAEKVARFVTMGAGLALLIAVWVGILSPALINWLLPENYTNAGQYALGLVLIMLLKELVELFNIGCFTGKTTTFQFIINLVAAIVGITAMLLLTPEYKVWGIILSLLLAQSIRLLLFYKASQYFLPLNYPLVPLLVFATQSIIWLLISSQIISLGQLIVILFLATGSLLATAQALKLIVLPINIRRRTLRNE